jgi:hypothetical protein
MPRTEKYFIGPQLLGDIRRVVGRVEAEPYRVTGGPPRVLLQDMPRAAREEIRFCSWTSTWAHNGTAAITFASDASATDTATNAIIGVGPGDGWVARSQTAGWSLVSFDMTKQPGYAGDGIQMFGHNASAVATWYSITTCTSSP